MGPKTLCNACGVRYKSGRLFPEYRPAASPTFIPSVHSNSHKKVLEMRTKSGTDDAPEMIPNKSNPALDYIWREGFGEFWKTFTMFPPSQSLLIFFYVFIFVIAIFISLFIVLFLYRVGNGGEIGAIYDKYFRTVEIGF